MERLEVAAQERLAASRNAAQTRALGTEWILNRAPRLLPMSLSSACAAASWWFIRRNAGLAVRYGAFAFPATPRTND